METPLAHPERGEVTLNTNDPVTIEAQDFSVLSPEGKVLAGPLNFTLPAGQRVVLVGTSGSGKSSLLNALSGFMAYTGSLRINKTELRELDPDAWRKQLSWVGQNPQLPAPTLRENRSSTAPGSASFCRCLRRVSIPSLAISLPGCQWARHSASRLPVRC